VGDSIPRHHAWSDDHLNRRLHHLHEGENGYLVEVLDSIVQLWRVEHVVQLSSFDVRIFLAEVCTVLLVVENNEEHVVSSECAVPISAGGNDQSQALHLAWELYSPGL